MQGIISWSINSFKRKQNKNKANIISLKSHDQAEEKVQSAGEKSILGKRSTQ